MIKSLLTLVVLLAAQGVQAESESFRNRGGESLGFFQIQSCLTGRCFDVEGAQTCGGAAVVNWNCHGGNNQVFEVLQGRSGRLRLRAAHSGMCLTINQHEKANLRQEPCGGGYGVQLFHRNFRDGGVQFRIGNSNLCLDVNRKHGTVYARRCENGGVSQLFNVRRY